MNRRFRRRRSRSILVTCAVLAIVIYRVWHLRQQPQGPQWLTEDVYQVERVVDGDTLLLSDRTRVRLQGIDTPETVKPDHPVEPWGPEASAFAKQFVGDGQVRLQFDRERIDQHGRLLAYVWKDDRLLNEELLRAGLARAQLQYRYSQRMKRRFREAEQEAKRAHRGIWSREK